MLALVGLGGNVGGDVAVLQRFRAAAREISRLEYVRDLESSTVYRSEPVGPVEDQPAFLNAALSFDVDAAVSPTSLLADLLRIESELGRARPDAIAKGPRSIDLDLLLVGEERAESLGPPSLSLPHPRIRERAFVLRPMRDLLGGDFVIPGAEQTVSQCLADPDVAGQRVRPLDEPLGARPGSGPGPGPGPGDFSTEQEAV